MPQTAINFTPRRGRPSAKQVAAIERAILFTAKQLFFEQNYDGVAMETIAAVAGVSKGTLYARYPSKEALFTAVVKESVQRWATETAPLEQTLQQNIEERLRYHAKTIARSLMLPEVRAFQKLLLGNRDRFPELSRAMHNVGYRYIVDLIVRDIRDMAERNGIPARDPETVAQMLVSAISGWQLQESTSRELTVEEIEAFGRRTVDLLLAARTLW